MVTVEKDVRLLVKKELATVNEDFPLFASAYEGWAKVRAALAGVETERYMLDRYVEQAIRLAAMICKLERSQRRWKRKAGKSA